MDGDVSAFGEARDHDVPGWYASMDQAFDLGNHDAGILIYVGIRGALRRNDRGAPAGKCFEDGGVVIQAETRVSRAGPEILDDPAMQVYEVCLSGVGNGGKNSSWLLCEDRSGDNTEQQGEPGFHAVSGG